MLSLLPDDCHSTNREGPLPRKKDSLLPAGKSIFAHSETCAKWTEFPRIYLIFMSTHKKKNRNQILGTSKLLFAISPNHT